MESYLHAGHYDLVTPDGTIVALKQLDADRLEAIVAIENISPFFVGYTIDQKRVFFNVKSTLAQLGVDGIATEYELNPSRGSARIQVELIARGEVGRTMLEWLSVGSYIGKLFAADENRLVRNPDYLRRMFERADECGLPLLSLGGNQGVNGLLMEKVEGRTVAFVTLLNGVIKYESTALQFLPTLARALMVSTMHTRALLQLDQTWYPDKPRQVQPGEILLVRTKPLHIRTMFGRVVESLLPKGYHHTSACVLEPTTSASGDVYELYGDSQVEITDIPIEFYTLEPYREYVYFSDRDKLQAVLDDPQTVFKVFETSPAPENYGAAVFVVKGSQLMNLKPQDWIARKPRTVEFPGLEDPERLALILERVLEQLPAYPFLKAMEDRAITSQGVLFLRYFPSVWLKQMLLNSSVLGCVKRIYFQYPSLIHGDFFAHEDRAFLYDLVRFGISVYWVDKTSQKVLQYIPKPNKDTGMFVPKERVQDFIKMTAFGIYGSNLIKGNFEEELMKLLKGLNEMRFEMHHALFNKDTPLGLVTGGGPGSMEVGNRVARQLNILSCARIIDFRAERDVEAIINEQRQNPYIDAKMTYRLDRLVERQAEFYLDFPIFLMGGIGTDFEFALEELRQKVGILPSNPILLFGSPDYWRKKITSRFQENLATGTIAGSEWVSNCVFCVQDAAQGLKIYRSFFSGTLDIGKNGPIYKDGFVV
ncbi:MAG TPA: hypothetical protein VGJ00_06445 [Rhabdochlamydiaceae bacterium]|jgi:hypothetical protein